VLKIRSRKFSVVRRQPLLRRAWHCSFDDSCWCEGEIAHSDQVIGRQSEAGYLIDSRHRAMTRVSQAADRFEPAEDLFDPFALTLIERVPSMACMR